MTWVFAVLVVLVMGGVAVLAAGRGEPMAPAETDDPPFRLPDERREVTAADLRGVRFRTAFRGYRMADVDALLDRLVREREAHDAFRPPPGGPDDARGEPPPT